MKASVLRAWRHKPLLARIRVHLDRALERAAPKAGPLRVAFQDDTDDAPEVFLQLSSLARPSVMIRYELPYRFTDGTAELALSTIAWDGLDGFEAWRDLSKPLASLSRLGRLDFGKPWIVTYTTRALADACRATDECKGQLHIVGGTPGEVIRFSSRLSSLGASSGAGASLREAVWWPARPALVLPLLGRATAVVPNGGVDPLALDARRAGVEVRGAHGADDFLPGIVPLSLLDNDKWWLRVARRALGVRRGQSPLPLLTAAWVHQGRTVARTLPANSFESQIALALRRYRKLQREPQRFFSESRYASVRALGSIWFSE